MMYETGEDIEYFHTYLKDLQELMPNSIKTVDLYESDMAKRFFAASGGYAREIANIIDTTFEMSDLTKKLEPQHYARGFAVSCSNGLADELNPFTAPIDEVDRHVATITGSVK